jgi:uncharacterized protein YkwD
MRRMLGRPLLALALMALAGPAAAAGAEPAWTCASSTGWLAANGQRADAPGVGGTPCPSAQSDAAGAAGPAGNLAATGTLGADGGGGSQTVDARKPQASIDAKSLAIHNADGKLALTASKLSATASASCDVNRVPVLTSSGSPGTVTLNGHAVDTSREYSEPGVGVNGAPLFGKITIRFNEVAKSGDSALTRRAIHLLVTDRTGAVLFEAVAGEVAIGRDGPVCDPPPVCPPGQEPRAGRCVDVTVTPLPAPPPPAAPLPPPVGPGPQPKPRPGPAPTPAGCRDVRARAGDVSMRRLQAAVLCLMNKERTKRRLRRLRRSADLSRAAGRHARDMVARRYFAHDEPSGPTVVDRILHSGYLERFGSWKVGENLGWGWGGGASPAAIVASWMKSPPHRRNILNRKFRDVGVAVRLGSPRGKRSRSITYVIDFGGFEPARRTR